MKLLAKILLAPLFLTSLFIQLMGLRSLGLMGRGLGSFLYRIGFRRKIVEENLTLAFKAELTKDEKDRLLRKIYRHIGTVFIEVLRNFSLGKKAIQYEFEIPETERKRMADLLSLGKGLVIITGHTANWELSAMGMAAHGYPVMVVVKRQSNPLSQVIIESLRKRSGLDVIYSGGVLEKMKLALKDNRIIGLVIDQNITGKKGIRVNFFGTPASSIRGLANLVRETGVPVLPMCCFRVPGGLHKAISLEPISYISAPELPEGSEERILREEFLNTQAYQHALEKLIRMQPENWLWIHRRWKADRTPIDWNTAHIGN